MRTLVYPHVPSSDAARVAYRVVRPGRHPTLRGAWWPRSTDLAAELPALINILDGRGFTAEWVSFGPGAWGETPQHVVIAGRVIRLAPFRAIDHDLVSLSGHDGRARIDLVVVPPGSSPDYASHAFGRVLDWDTRQPPPLVDLPQASPNRRTIKVIR